MGDYYADYLDGGRPDLDGSRADFRDGIVGGGNGDTSGYDAQFNDGVLSAMVRGTARARPTQWPRSASEMGRLVRQMDEPHLTDGAVNDRALRAALSTSGRTRPAMWPASASETGRLHAEFPEQNFGEGATAHLRWAGRGQTVVVPHPSRRVMSAR